MNNLLTAGNKSEHKHHAEAQKTERSHRVAVSS
jgi:hypothetical protein